MFSASVYNENLSVAYDHHELQYSFQVVGGRIRDFGLIKIKAGWTLGTIIETIAGEGKDEIEKLT